MISIELLILDRLPGSMKPIPMPFANKVSNIPHSVRLYGIIAIKAAHDRRLKKIVRNGLIFSYNTKPTTSQE